MPTEKLYGEKSICVLFRFMFSFAHEYESDNLKFSNFYQALEIASCPALYLFCSSDIYPYCLLGTNVASHNAQNLSDSYFSLNPARLSGKSLHILFLKLSLF